MRVEVVMKGVKEVEDEKEIKEGEVMLATRN